MTQDEDWAAAVELTVAEFGKLDVLFNNAGIFNGGQLQRYKTEQWQQMLDVNLTGAFLGIRAAADAMIAAGGGSIINTSSIEGLRGTPWAHGYVASKWGLTGLTKSVAMELAPHGIRVNSLHPGRISTPATDQMPEDLIPIPLGRPGLPEEVASFVRVPRQRRVVLRHRLGVRRWTAAPSCTSRPRSDQVLTAATGPVRPTTRATSADPPGRRPRSRRCG